MSTESPHHSSFKTISLKYDFKHIWNDFIHVYSSRTLLGRQPLGDKFWCQQKFLIILPVCCQFKQKISLKSDFLLFSCVFFSHVYSPRQGQTLPIWDKNFMTTKKAFSLCSNVASFKMISSKTAFIHISNDFIHVYSPGARAENPCGTNFWCQQKALITLTICCKFQTDRFEFWFYTHFLMFFHMYIALWHLWQGQTTLCWQNPDVNRKALSLCWFVTSFKKNIFEVWFYTQFFMFLYMYVDPGQGQATSWGQNFYININLLSLWSFAVSFFH